MRTWWSSTAAIAAGVLLVLGLSAAAACDHDGGLEAADTDTGERDCEEMDEHYCECYPDDCQEWLAGSAHDSCEEDVYGWWECAWACDEIEACESWDDCVGECG